MKVAYFDCFSGASGDMILGALIDAGFAYQELESELSKLPLEDFDFDVSRATRGGIMATHVSVSPEDNHVVRYWGSIRRMLDESALDATVRTTALGILHRLVEAEARIHNKNIEQVHFHELGSVDTLVDVVGVSVALNRLGIERIYVSPVATGYGMVKTEHGALPVPAPATAELLRDVPIYGGSVIGELTTPTGAAILSTMAHAYGQIPPMQVETIGYGAGSRDHEVPNLLRVMLGELIPETATRQKLVLASCNLDDLSPEIYGYLLEKLFAAGALDAWITPVQMKKSRPGCTVSALLPPERADAAAEALFRESSTLGVRLEEVERRELVREELRVEVEGRQVRVKAGHLGSETVNLAPEYEDCAALARATGMPVKEILHLARETARQQLAQRTPTASGPPRT